MMRKKIIFGCDSRGDAQSPYLTRWTLVSCPLFAVYIHRFHRSDSPEHHDHPWAFTSLILWRGYFEETAWPVEREAERMDWDLYHKLVSISLKRSFTTKEYQAFMKLDCLAKQLDLIEGMDRPRKRAWPGMMLFRRASHRHRVVLVEDKEAWTLVIRGPYSRQWGFFTSKGWQHWRDYFRERGC